MNTKKIRVVVGMLGVLFMAASILFIFWVIEFSDNILYAIPAGITSFLGVAMVLWGSDD